MYELVQVWISRLICSYCKKDPVKDLENLQLGSVSVQGVYVRASSPLFLDFSLKGAAVTSGLLSFSRIFLISFLSHLETIPHCSLCLERLHFLNHHQRNTSSGILGESILFKVCHENNTILKLSSWLHMALPRPSGNDASFLVMWYLLLHLNSLTG